MCIQELGNNKYRLILSSGYKLNRERKRVTKTVTAKSKREAEKMAVAMQAELDGDNNDILTDTTTFTELVKRYKALGMADLAEKTKNGTPVRTVVVPKGLCDILRHYKNSVGLCGGSNWIFTKDKELDKPMHPDTPSQWFARFLERNNLPIITLHQLRHTSVSIMIFQGVDIHTIASQRGHSANVMLGTYAHVMNRAKTEAADKLQKEFF